MKPPGVDSEREPDIVLVILQMVQQEVPALSAETARAIELQVRDQYGGLRTRIAKRKKHPTPELRAKVFQEALTATPDAELTASYGISRRTLYRYLKRGGQ
ncbi:hypothetical protein [Ramlibacter sp. Leaf400]|uniref:hypothetical protein n=1 Tax=Ramlibacter sp. Leaf400 TaxID=1736365 RepID=UPI0006F3A40B|nr:hypothetical protein [Ramlibacter sp. Leaf400]KQT10975.1 hypothetical protein ASG30_09255 [Ramlibacter sp. Leaf400]